MAELKPDDIEFKHESTFFGFVVMVRTAVRWWSPYRMPGTNPLVWSKWRKAEYNDMLIYESLNRK